ncbi:hypothetical protein [Winogradskyella vincentii]|uniref:Lipoprotein n=1 Tax=Winogradskyella vincentii TaxID=2877122 RepID=A0ABS7Y4K3_9FLAO|nr:hypothetical protein [Winogradskyella vincentii]MCA0154265.1 hypothetical protein [Winogradskyella vincentii]
MKNILMLISTLLVTSCANNNIEAEFIEIKNKIARFDVVNNSNKDISKITLEIRFLDSSDNLLLVDTLDYQMGNDYRNEKLPFLKANDKTFIVQSAPDNCLKADIKILEIENIK